MTRAWLLCRSALFAALVLGMNCAGRAEEKARAAEFLKLADQEAAAYTFHSDIPGASFVLHPEPILKWSNPVIGSIHGGVYIWTNHGRPEAVSSIYKWYSPFRHRTNEFQSLSFAALTMKRDGEVVWMPSRPGVELKTLPDAPVPAGTPAQRLRQMRELATRFTARQTDRKLVERDMRLLAQPIYRYEKTEGDLVDGALFVFTLATDPEAILLIEARQIAGAPRWQYGLARLNSIEMRVSDRGREVWNVATLAWPEVQNHRGTYTTFLFNFHPVEAAPPADR